MRIPNDTSYKSLTRPERVKVLDEIADYLGLLKLETAHAVRFVGTYGEIAAASWLDIKPSDLLRL